MKNDSKWYRVYQALMMHAKNREKPNGYTELHHIIPKSVGGDDLPENIVRLTAREHLIAHRLWVRFENDPIKKRKAQGALWAMVTMRGKDNAGRIIPNSRIYEEAKIALKESKRGRKRPNDVKEKISATLKKHFNENGSHNLGRSFSHLSPEERSIIFGAGNRGRVQSAEEREKRAAKLRKPRSAEAKANIKLGALKREAARRQNKTNNNL